VLLFAGYPVWWLLGITLPLTVVVVAMLALELKRMPRIRFPRYGTLWGLFMAWVLIGVLVVQVDAPYAVAGWNANRYLTWALRLFWYVAATVVLVHLGNVTDRVARARLFVSFGWMFVWIVIGGYLGALAPSVDFPSVLEFLLPHRLATNAFVMSLVHPNLAEQMEFAGVTRPSAPFPYANVWGLNFACFLPFFVVGWGRATGWKRRITPLVLVASVVPVVMSLNRGLWIGLGVATVVVVIRAAMAGNARLVAVLGLGVTLLAVVIALSPLHAIVTDRLSSPNSNAGRSELASRGFASTLESPVVGFGTTRDVQGSLSSIAGGSTPDCPRCGAPSFGTQGQVFLTTFAQGYVGAAFYLGFLGLVLVRSVRRRGATVTMALGVVAMHGATLFVYSADNLAILPIFAATGILWRAADGERVGTPALLELARARPRWLAAAVAGGGLAGLVVFVATPHQAAISTPVLVDSAATASGAPPVTLDTIARLVTDRSVVAAVARASHDAPDEVGAHLRVTADPNTRVLVLTYSAYDRRDARAGSQAAAQSLLALWQQQLTADESARQHELAANLDGISDALAVVGNGRAALDGHQWGPVGHSAGRQLLALQQQLVTRWTAVDAMLRTTTADAPSSGAVVGRPGEIIRPLPWAQRVGEGCALGLLAFLAPALRPHRRPHRPPNRPPNRRPTSTISASRGMEVFR